MSHAMPTQDLLDCMQACVECSSSCAQCAHHCLHMGDDHGAPTHQGLMQDCAEICGVTARFLARASHHASSLCEECAEICAACAESCERLAEGDAMMQRCAEICRYCALECSKMVGATV